VTIEYHPYDPPESSLQLLERARDLLCTGWEQRAFLRWRKRDGKKVMFCCLDGALRVASGASINDIVVNDVPKAALPLFSAVQHSLGKKIRERYGNHYWGIWSFNDDPHTTKKDILTLVDAVIAQEKERV